MKDYKDFTERLGKTLEGACIPLLDIYLNKINDLNTSMPDLLGEGLINFGKRKAFYALLKELILYQQRPYILEPVPAIQEYLSKVSIWETDIIEEFSMLLQEEEEVALYSSKQPKGTAAVFEDGSRLVGCMKSIYAQDALLRHNLKTMLRDHIGLLATRDTTRFLAELFVELSQCKRDVLKESVRLNMQMLDKNNITTGRKNASDELYERFGGQKMTQWKMTDDWGVVYSWTDEVVASMLHKGDEGYIVEIRPYVDIAQVAAFASNREIL